MALLLQPKSNRYYFLNIGTHNCRLLLGFAMLLFSFSLLSAATPPIKSIAIENANCGIADGSILIELSNPANNYTFDWAPNLGIGALNRRDSLPAGIYEVTITDNSDPSCFVVRQLIVEHLDGPEAVLAFSTAAACRQSTARAILAPIDFDYSWSDGGSGNNRTDLAAGQYFVTVTRPFDGCRNYLEVNIEESNTLIVQLINSQAASCGQSNGQLGLQTGGGSANLTYTWSDAGSGASRNDLAAGTYTVTITDNSPIGCTAIREFVVAELSGTPAILTVSGVVSPDCPGDQNGQVLFDVQYDGTIQQPADTLLTDAMGQAAINGALASGQYCLSIVDGSACLAAQACFQVENAPALEVDVAVTDKGCITLGSILLDISGGTGSYTFDWGDLPGNNDPGNRGALEPDNYNLTITDGNACTTTISDIVVLENCITGCQAIGGTISTTDPLVYCVDDGMDDIIFFQRSGNNGPNYVLLLTDANGIILESNNTNFNLEGRDAGTCTVYGVAFDSTVSGLTQNENISDITGCFELSNGIAITKLTGANCNNVCTPPIISSVSVADASCEVDDGQIRISTLQDTSNYQFDWMPNVGNGAWVDSLATGVYSVTISDLSDPSCNLVQTFSVGTVDGPEVEILSVTPASCLENNGTALVSPTIYQYEWCGGQTSFNPTDLFAGICYVTVTDPLSLCTTIVDVEIDTLVPFRVSVDINAAPTCGQANGEVTIEVDDGSTFYTYEWSNGATTANLSGLSAGVYEVTVTDLGPTGCVQILTFALTETTVSAAIALDSILFNSCPGANDVLIDLTTTTFDPGFGLPASFEIRNGEGVLATNGALAPDNYCLLIFDNSGCLAGERCFEVRDPDPLIINVEVINLDCNALGRIELNVSGGSGNYTYDWADLPGNNDPADRIDLMVGTYSLRISDGNACVAVFDTMRIVDACVPCPVLDSMQVLVATNDNRTVCVPVEALCYDRALTFFSLQGGGISGSSAFGNWTLQPQGCLEYTANGMVGTAVDTIYVLAGFNGLSDTTCIFISITDDLSFNPGPDTLYLTTNEASTIDTCLDLRALTDTLASTQILANPTQGTLAFNNPQDSSCISYTPNAGVTGNFVDSLGLVFCDANNICDTTWVIFSVVPANCPDIVVLERDTIVEFDCGATVNYCLGIRLFDIINYQLFVDGQLYTNGFNPCNNVVNTGYDLGELLMQFPTGPYVLDSWEVNGQTFSIDTIQSFQQLADSLQAWDPTGQWSFDGQSKLFGGLASSTYGQLVLRQLGSLVQVRINLFADDEALGTLIQLPANSGQLIINELATACQDTLLFEVDCRNCPTRYNGPDTLISMDCTSPVPLCLEIGVIELQNFEILDNGQLYAGSITACALDSIYNYGVANLQQGPFQLNSWVVNNDTLRLSSFANLQELVDSMNAFDPGGNWQLIGQVISGGGSGRNYGPLLIAQNGIPFPTIVPSLQQIPRSVSVELDTGFHQLILADTTIGCIDTFNIQVECQPSNGALDTLLFIAEMERDSFCPDLSAFGNITVDNLCPTQSDGNADWNFNANTGCFELTGQTLGRDTFCFEVCDSVAGICDTFTVGVQVLPLTTTQTIDLVVGLTDTICLDTSLFQAALDTLFNDCPQASGTFADLFPLPGTPCVEINGEAIGTDSACLVLCDVLGNCDTTFLIINVTAPQPDTIREFVMIGGQSTYCLDTTELSGTLDTLYNICPDASGTAVAFSLDTTTFCVDFEGLDMGLDTACLVFCDDLICDTTILIIEAIRGSTDPPVAIDDDRQTSRNVSIEIDILSNDTINGSMPEIFILQGPQLGNVQVTPNQTFIYVPDLGICERVDSFSYILRTSTGEDTATVTINIVCEDLTIFNGFSPNGDTVNDTWRIPGIENFPNNRVCVFNRWGNQVFCEDNYQNTTAWDGTWEGKDLPDGTYFYVIDDGEGNEYSGYVQLHR